LWDIWIELRQKIGTKIYSKAPTGDSQVITAQIEYEETQEEEGILCSFSISQPTEKKDMSNGENMRRRQHLVEFHGLNRH
jgi:hypothetical protein